MQGWIAPSVMMLALVVAGCGGGGGTESSGRGSGAGGEAASTGPEGCTGHDASREAVCVASGCRWGQALVCMGTAHADDIARPPQPCACVCAEDELACSMVPSAAPGP